MTHHLLRLAPCFLLVGCMSSSDTVEADLVEPVTSVPDVQARKLESAPAVELTEVGNLVGVWVVTLEHVTQGEDRARTVAHGTATISPDLNGRFLCWMTTLESEGETIASRGRLGFDRRLEVYELLWVSELSSAQRLARGRGDARRGGIQLDWGDVDPETQSIMRSRTVLKIADDDHFSLEQWALNADLEWVPVWRTSYTRASS